MKANANCFVNVKEVFEKIKAAGLRADIDLRNEKINYKVREHSHAKVPAILVVGQKEADENKVSIRRIGSKDQTVTDLDDAITALTLESKMPNGEA